MPSVPEVLATSRSRAQDRSLETTESDDRPANSDAPISTPHGPCSTRYRFGFAATTIRCAVERWIDLHGGKHGDVAGMLGLPGSTLSEYLNRRRIPSDERIEDLRRIGLDPATLRRAIHADRLQAWLDAQDLTWEDVAACAAMVCERSRRLHRLRDLARGDRSERAMDRRP